MCTAIQAALPAMQAQHTQKIAWVNSGLEDSTLRMTDISREQYTRKPLKCVEKICTCCAETQKSRKFYWDFFLGLVLADLKRLARLRARKDSLEYLGKACRYASRASSGVGRLSGKPSFWAV